MKPVYKGLLVAGLQVGIVLSLGAKLLYDRATRPRVWASAAPYDPDLPIRSRYVSLQLQVHAPNVPRPSEDAFWIRPPVILSVEQDQLVAVPGPESSENRIRFVGRGTSGQAVLEAPVAFFIPEHVPDPSRRPEGDELWVEVTLPKKGPPRPIRLGVKGGDGPIVPLNLR